MADSSVTKPCKRCKAVDAPFNLRADPTCSDCYVLYVSQKMSKRLGALHRDTRTSNKPEPRRYVAGLSFGPSSSAMAQILDENSKRHSGKSSSSAFDMLVVHVDTDLSHPTDATQTPARTLLEKYRERFSGVKFECVHLSEVLKLRSIDWATLPLKESDGEPCERLIKLFDALPTVTSRADILRLFIRHVLIDFAIQKGFGALLLGQNTTSLAALTLSEVANGRGFSIPWQVNDGKAVVCSYEQQPDGSTKPGSSVEFPVYYPMREVFRNEVLTYIDLVPSLSDLVVKEQKTTNSVVSYKDLSIDEVMTRYFESVEDSYSGIVANVVRTTGKLGRIAGGGFCGSCGMTLDEEGDSRWAGDLGDDPGGDSRVEGWGKLCHGCKRSIHG